MQSLEDLIKRLKGVPSGEVARLAGVDRSTVFRVINRRHSPRLETFEALWNAASVAGRKRRKAAA